MNKEMFNLRGSKVIDIDDDVIINDGEGGFCFDKRFKDFLVDVIETADDETGLVLVPGVNRILAKEEIFDTLKADGEVMSYNEKITRAQQLVADMVDEVLEGSEREILNKNLRVVPENVQRGFYRRPVRLVKPENLVNAFNEEDNWGSKKIIVAAANGGVPVSFDGVGDSYERIEEGIFMDRKFVAAEIARILNVKTLMFVVSDNLGRIKGRDVETAKIPDFMKKYLPVFSGIRENIEVARHYVLSLVKAFGLITDLEDLDKILEDDLSGSLLVTKSRVPATQK